MHHLPKPAERRPRASVLPRGTAALLAALLASAAAVPLGAQAPAAPPPPAAPAPVDSALVGAVRAYLDSLHASARFPGASAAIALPDGRLLAATTGWADTAAKRRMRPDDLLLQGSVGKTYVAAVALQLVGEGKLRLDAPIAEYLRDEPWLARLPNGDRATVRHLMTHTSGLVRYEFDEAFVRDLVAQPDKVWTPADRLAYVLDERPPFAPGEGWEYSDTNYIVLGVIVERITGRPLYEEIERRLLRAHRLARTVPSASRTIPGLVQGYAGPRNPFGGTDAMIVDGRFAFNPQFEWAGGGFASTAGDLARWAKILYEGRAFAPALVDTMLAAVPAPALGGEARYGLGVIVRAGPLGASWGHSGYFPGYLTEMRYFPEHRIAVAFQVNTSAQGALGRSPGAIATDLARLAVETGTSR
jgi:D-alanyl-D-alanine carboxypeptidase